MRCCKLSLYFVVFVVYCTTRSVNYNCYRNQLYLNVQKPIICLFIDESDAPKPRLRSLRGTSRRLSFDRYTHQFAATTRPSTHSHRGAQQRIGDRLPTAVVYTQACCVLLRDLHLPLGGGVRQSRARRATRKLYNFADNINRYKIYSPVKSRRRHFGIRRDCVAVCVLVCICEGNPFSINIYLTAITARSSQRFEVRHPALNPKISTAHTPSPHVFIDGKVVWTEPTRGLFYSIQPFLHISDFN